MSNGLGATIRRYSFALLRRVAATAVLTLLGVTGASAQLLVTDNFGPSVLTYNQTTGAFEGTLIPPGSGGLVTAHGIAIGPDGNIYVGGSSGAINRYSPSGAFLGVFTSGATIDGALFVIFGPDGHLYASDYAGSAAIRRFNGTSGAFIDTFVTAGSGGLGFPNGMAFGPDGHFYVASGNSSSVKRYNGTTGAYMGNFATGPTDPRGLVFGPDGHLYVSFDGIRRYDGATGAFMSVFASGAGLDRPYGVTFGPDGHLYVANDGPHPGEILRYDGATGAFIDVFAAGGGLGSPKYFAFAAGPAVGGPPTADAGANQSIHVGQVVQLDGSGSFDDTTPTQDLQFAWSFASLPSGSTATLSSPTAINPTFVADLPGAYVVGLVVTDADDLWSSHDEVTISSLNTNTPPNADAGPDVGGVVGSLVNVDGSASNDPDFDPITYSWTLAAQPAGSTATLSNANASEATLVPDVAGSYVAQLVVTDPFGSTAQDQVTITVITAADFAAQQIMDALNAVGSLPPGSVTTKGNQTALGNFLTQAIDARHAGDMSGATKKLRDAIERTDGCALRGSPDASGGGQIKQDYIKTCTDQAPVYQPLKDALDALSGL